MSEGSGLYVVRRAATGGPTICGVRRCGQRGHSSGFFRLPLRTEGTCVARELTTTPWFRQPRRPTLRPPLFGKVASLRPPLFGKLLHRGLPPPLGPEFRPLLQFEPTDASKLKACASAGDGGAVDAFEELIQAGFEPQDHSSAGRVASAGRRACFQNGHHLRRPVPLSGGTGSSHAYILSSCPPSLLPSCPTDLVIHSSRVAARRLVQTPQHQIRRGAVARSLSSRPADETIFLATTCPERVTRCERATLAGVGMSIGLIGRARRVRSGSGSLAGRAEARVG